MVIHRWVCVTLLWLQLLGAGAQTPHGCVNDTDCYTENGAWRCAEATGNSTLPCHINGRQQDTPPYNWPLSRCACTAPAPCDRPGPPPATATYGCRSERCIGVLSGGTANSTTSCEWATGCVGLHANEWLAATFEWRLANSTLTCQHVDTFLKKSQEPSSTLPSQQKLAVGLGTVVPLVRQPLAPEDGYWIVACANGTVCGARPELGASATAAAHGPVSRRNGAAAVKTYLMIGDSISEGYLPATVEALGQAFDVKHSPGNAGNANNIVHRLPCFLRDTFPSRPDVVTFNAGIHDLARGQEWLSLEVYAALMANISTALQTTAHRVILVTTTPVPTNASDPSQPACPEGILESDVRRYNAAAKSAARAAGVEVLDLHATVAQACGANYTTCAIQEPNNPHFLAAGWKLLGDAVARAVASQQ